MGKMSREKGKRGERELANILKQHGYSARRGVQYHGGEDSPDVVGLPGVHIEVKRTERLNAYAAMKQSINDAGNDIPVVAHRKNGESWIVLIGLEDFLKIYAEKNKGRTPNESPNSGDSQQQDDSPADFRRI